MFNVGYHGARQEVLYALAQKQDNSANHINNISQTVIGCTKWLFFIYFLIFAHLWWFGGWVLVWVLGGEGFG